MNRHFQISIAKSILRISACIVALFPLGPNEGIDRSLAALAIGFLLAEVLGIIEEIADTRK